MLIPLYVKDLMDRSSFAIGYGDPGYTIEIKKRTHYSQVSTLESEIKRLESWVKRIMPEDELDVPTMIINKIPKKTTYKHMQYAVVTIYDPVMKELEKYIKRDGN